MRLQPFCESRVRPCNAATGGVRSAGEHDNEDVDVGVSSWARCNGDCNLTLLVSLVLFLCAAARCSRITMVKVRMRVSCETQRHYEVMPSCVQSEKR